MKEGDTARVKWFPERFGKLVRLGPEVSTIKFHNLGDRHVLTKDIQVVKDRSKAMADSRLEYWETLGYEELGRRVQAELTRNDLTFGEQQLLKAAQERLLSWKEPNKVRSKKMSEDTENPMPEGSPSGETQGDSSVKKPARKKAAAKKPAAKKTAAKKPAAAKAVASKGNGRNGRIDPDAKVVWLGKENPFREGSGSYKRVDIVQKSSKQTAGAILKKSGIKETTLATCKRLGLIRIEA